MTANRVITGATDTPTNTDDGKILILDRAGGGTITLDTDANQTWAQADTFGLVAKQGNWTIDPATGVNVDGSNASFVVNEGDGLVLINEDGADEWQKGDEGGGGAGTGFPLDWTEQSGTTYTILAADINETVELTNAAAVTVTLPSSLGAVDDQVAVKAGGAGGTTVTAGSGVTFDPPGDVVLSQGMVASFFQSAADTWEVVAPEPVMTSAQAQDARGTTTAVKPSPYRLWETNKYLHNIPAFGGTHAVFTDAHAVPGAVLTATGTLAVTANTGYYSFWYTPNDITITEVGIELDTAAGGETAIRVGVFKADEDYQPNATGLIGQGVVTSPSTAGFKTITGLSWACPAGRYLTIVVSDAASTFRWHQASSMGGDVIGRDLQSSTPGIEFGTLASLGAGAFADPESDWTAVTSGAGGVKHIAGFNWTRD